MLCLTLAACDVLSADNGPTHQFVLQAQFDDAQDGGADDAQLMETTIEVLTHRLEALDVRLHRVEQRGEDEIVLALSGDNAVSALHTAIGQRGELSFKLVDEAALYENTLQGIANPGSKILPHADFGEPIAVMRLGGISGRHITNARAGINEYTDEAVVNFEFDTEGAEKFARLSAANVGRRFAIVLDGVVLSAPVIYEPILGGQAQISGNFTAQSANELAIIIASGALPVDVVLLEERLEGPEF